MNLLSVLFYAAGNVLWNVVSFGTSFSQFFQHGLGLTLMAQKLMESKSSRMTPHGWNRRLLNYFLTAILFSPHWEGWGVSGWEQGLAWRPSVFSRLFLASPRVELYLPKRGAVAGWQGECHKAIYGLVSCVAMPFLCGIGWLCAVIKHFSLSPFTKMHIPAYRLRRGAAWLENNLIH